MLKCDRFIPYQSPYTVWEKLARSGVVYAASLSAMTQFLRQGKGFAASIEITDRCNAGCHYCYVYPPDWDQDQRMQGYLQLSKTEHRTQEQQVIQTLEELQQSGVVHVTLVGGETALAPKVVQRAAALFPIVWVVTNGAAKLPTLPKSTTIFVSLDGLPEHHNQSRDPLGYFAAHRYGDLTGMSAAIVRNINESERGAYIHLTLTPPTLEQFPALIDGLVKDVTKLRGIVVSGATVSDPADPLAFQLHDRQTLKHMIKAKAQDYGWRLFPFNQPRVNQLLFDPKHIIRKASDCAIAKRITSLDFNGNSVGKCILRNKAVCETCVCNMTALQGALEKFDLPTITHVMPTLFG